jgi:RimJ/RimL family protein N-acetyltransferase
MGDLRQRFGWLRRRAEARTRSGAGAMVRAGELVSLRRHVPANRAAFQRWYADDEIARLLRHDQRPLNDVQSRSYFDTLILPTSAQGLCYAIHESGTGRLIGTTALTDLEGTAVRSAYFRIVIGEKDCWGKGYGTEATRLVMDEAFETHRLNLVKLEVFRHNPRAIRAYGRVGFVETGEHIEFVGRQRWELHVVEMELVRDGYERARQGRAAADAAPTRDQAGVVTTTQPEGPDVGSKPPQTDCDTQTQNPRSYAD